MESSRFDIVTVILFAHADGRTRERAVTLIAIDQAGAGCASLRAQLQERLLAECVTLQRARALADDLQVFISQAEIDDLLAMAARNDIAICTPVTGAA
jgi:hypothetical protein